MAKHPLHDKLDKHVKKYIKQFDFKKVLHIEDTPARIALSFSLGVFIGFLPLLWFHIFLIIPIIIFFRVNKVAILLGTFISHPFAMYLLTPVSFHLGKLILGVSALELSWQNLYVAYWPLFVGSVVLGLAAALVTYPIAYYSVSEYRKRKNWQKKKKIEKKSVR